MKNETNMKIPKKYHHMIDEIDHDSDGYWCYTAYGFYSPFMDCHTIHEDTQKELLEVIRGIEPCYCDECKEALKKKLPAFIYSYHNDNVLEIIKYVIENSLDKKELAKTHKYTCDWGEYGLLNMLRLKLEPVGMRTHELEHYLPNEWKELK